MGQIQRIASTGGLPGLRAPFYHRESPHLTPKTGAHCVLHGGQVQASQSPIELALTRKRRHTSGQFWRHQRQEFGAHTTTGVRTQRDCEWRENRNPNGTRGWVRSGQGRSNQGSMRRTSWKHIAGTTRRQPTTRSAYGGTRFTQDTSALMGSFESAGAFGEPHGRSLGFVSLRGRVDYACGSCCGSHPERTGKSGWKESAHVSALSVLLLFFLPSFF
jgi:hypothetical protein